MKHQPKIFTYLMIFLFAIACKKETINLDTNTTRLPVIPQQPASNTNLAGFGNNIGTPAGSPYQLPYNIEVTIPIRPENQTSYINSNYTKYGIGGILAFLTIKNFNNFDSEFTLPAGLTFLPDTNAAPTGIILYPVKVKIPANTSEKIALRFFSINLNKLPDYANFYFFHLVSNNEQVETLTNALKIKTESVLIKHTHELSHIVWNISDRYGLTNADLRRIGKWQ